MSAQPAALAEVGAIHVQNVSIRLGSGNGSSGVEVLHDVSLDVAPGEFVCLLGPSGCGKSTLLGALAGHLPPTQGQLQLDGRAIQGPGAERGLVFQHHTLFPWKTVLDNVAFGLKMKGVGRQEREQQAHSLLGLVGLSEFANSYPRALSGGMQQRVEIARALINHPSVLLMDEPFGALDALTRVTMQELLLEIWERIRTTVVFVTHDIEEALFLADRIVVMGPRPARIVEDLRTDFERPRHQDMITDPRFVSLKLHCLEMLHHGQASLPLELERLSPLGQFSRRPARRFPV